MGYMADVWMQYRNTEGVRWNVSGGGMTGMPVLQRESCLHMLSGNVPELMNGWSRMNKAGKPFIKDIQFSISHTEGCVAAAIGSEPCGIDVERVRRIPDSIVNRMYSDEDKKCVMSCAHPEIYSTCVWTRREAYSKMTGTGILMKDEEQQMVMDNAHMEKKNIWLGNYAVCRAECDGRMHMDEIADPAHAEGDMNIDFIVAFCAASDGTFSPDIKMIDSADIVCYYV